MWELWKWKKSIRPKNEILLNEFVRNEVKYRQIALTYQVSIQTVWKRINEIEFNVTYNDSIKPQKIILLMDTTYFWRKYGYMIFRAWFPETNTWKNILRYKVPYETNDMYRKWYAFLKEQWREIVGIVCDWRQGLLWWFWIIPTQMCVRHMKEIMRRYLTKKPKLEQNKSLKVIADCIWEYSEEDINLALDVRHSENKKWFFAKNMSWKYVHERTRKAYYSLKKKLSRCYIFVKYSELWIPNTNNSLESINAHLKTKIKIHRGLKEWIKETFINYYLYIS